MPTKDAWYSDDPEIEPEAFQETPTPWGQYAAVLAIPLLTLVIGFTGYISHGA